MSKRNHLRRLEPEFYRSDAMVHWSMTIRDRDDHWLSSLFLYRFRELLTHTMFRYGLACPIFCLMPDHFHMLWMGLCSGSDQLLAMKHFHKTCNESLQRIDAELQDQAYDNVLKGDELTGKGFRAVWDYIARNPERAGLVPVDGYSTYRFSGCVIPGYPELRIFEDGYWDRFDRIISFLRKEGLMRMQP